MPGPINLVGQRFGRLTVTARTNNDRSGTVQWACLCDCGKSSVVRRYDLVKGLIVSCGCKRNETRRADALKHGYTKTPIHNAWIQIKARCFNPKCKAYKYYGARGITMCDRWRNSFTDFLADMGERPSDKHSIDRIDNNGNYEPGNCRWATRIEQNRNKRQRQKRHAGAALARELKAA